MSSTAEPKKEPVFNAALTTNVDMNGRVVEFVERQKLIIHPTKILVPFAVLKNIVGHINIHEGQLELGGRINNTVTDVPSGDNKPS